MRKWTRIYSFFVPGGVFLLGAAFFAQSGWFTLAVPSLTFVYYCALLGGMLLAWRFHSIRVFCALLVMFLAKQGIAFAGVAHAQAGTPAVRVLGTVSILLVVNVVAIALMTEHAVTLAGLAPPAVLLFVEAVFVAVIGRSAEPVAPHFHRVISVPVPAYVLLGFGLSAIILLSHSLLTRKPADIALFWSLAGFFLALHFANNVQIFETYSIAVVVMLASSVVETSYLLAYHDELTGLPSRRAFNDALTRLQPPFSIAAIDIDHFKRFNDTYGHDVGDQVLRLVASKLARVGGGGDAYRCGGEEFVILFPRKKQQEVVDHLEQLRATVESAEFRMRGTDRRQSSRGPDRRNGQARGRAKKGQMIRRLAHEPVRAALSVTISIGVASSSPQCALSDVILKTADKALYRAKENGRNRLETAGKLYERGKAAGIA
jgi:diguanylate cyclase (GGDEF)-like protein